MTGAAFQIVRVVVVVALLIAAALLATPQGRLPLALRGVYKIMKRDRAEPERVPEVKPPSTLKRTLAFLLVLVAVALCVC